MKIWAVMERDLRRLMRNPLTLLSGVFLPVIYLLILGNSLQGPLKHLRVGVVTLDSGPAARALLGALVAVQNGPATVELVAMSDPEAGMSALRRGRLAGLLVVPPRFSSDVLRGLNGSVGLYVDNAESVAAAAITAALEATLPVVTTGLVRFERTVGPPEVRVEEIYPRVDYDASLVPGVVVMAIFMGSMISGGFNLVLDRFLGVEESYLSTPLRRSDIAMGVLASGSVVTLLSSGVVLTIGLLLTGSRIHGGPLGYVAMFLVAILTSLGLLAMMMAVVGRAAHPRIVGVIAGFLNVMLFFPSGALYPVQSFPGWLRAFASINPETHAIAAMKSILFRGGNLMAATEDVLFLALFAAVMLVIATVTLKRTL